MTTMVTMADYRTARRSKEEENEEENFYSYVGVIQNK